MPCFRCKEDGHSLGCDAEDADVQCEICGKCAAKKEIEREATAE